MKIFVLVLLLKVLTSIDVSVAKEVSCEKVDNESYWWEDAKRNVRTCFMQTTTSIDEPETTISTRDSSVKGLNLSVNSKILHLPINVNESFSNLEEYHASSCAVKEITKRNFNGLNKLKNLYWTMTKSRRSRLECSKDWWCCKNFIYVSENQFMFFQLLTPITVFSANNKIKFMNVEAFRDLSKLKKLYFNGNICISENFWNSTQIAEFQAVNKKCKFEE